MTTPASPVVEQNRAQDLMRLGWAIAELRGRVYFRPVDPGCMAGKAVARADHSLPLSAERSPKELLIETSEVVQALAKQTSLEFDGSHRKDSSGNAPAAPCTAAARVAELASQVPEQRSESSWHAAWNAFTLALYQWDAAIQDKLASASFGESSAYQLGWGLAECSLGARSRVPTQQHYGLGTRARQRTVRGPDPPARAAGACRTCGNGVCYQGVAGRLAAGVTRLLLAERHDTIGRGLPSAPGRRLARHDSCWHRPANIRAATCGATERRQYHPDYQRTVGPACQRAYQRRHTRCGVWAITEYGNSKPWGALVSALGIFGITTSSLLGSFAEPITLPKLTETPLLPDMAA